MKNQTLEIGSYLIPEGCKATVMGGEVIISIKKDNRIKEGDWRCKDCIHRKEGKTSINAWSMSWVCELKPKTVRNPRFANQNYSTAPIGMIRRVRISRERRIEYEASNQIQRKDPL